MKLKSSYIHPIVQFIILSVWNLLYIIIEINFRENYDLTLWWPLTIIFLLPANIIFVVVMNIMTKYIYDVFKLYSYVIVFLLGIVQTFKLFYYFTSDLKIGWWLTYLIFFGPRRGCGGRSRRVTDCSGD